MHSFFLAFHAWLLAFVGMTKCSFDLFIPIGPNGHQVFSHQQHLIVYLSCKGPTCQNIIARNIQLQVECEGRYSFTRLESVARVDEALHYNMGDRIQNFHPLGRNTKLKISGGQFYQLNEALEYFGQKPAYDQPDRIWRVFFSYWLPSNHEFHDRSEIRLNIWTRDFFMLKRNRNTFTHAYRTANYVRKDGEAAVFTKFPLQMTKVYDKKINLVGDLRHIYPNGARGPRNIFTYISPTALARNMAIPFSKFHRSLTKLRWTNIVLQIVRKDSLKFALIEDIRPTLEELVQKKFNEWLAHLTEALAGMVPYTWTAVYLMSDPEEDIANYLYVKELFEQHLPEVQLPRWVENLLQTVPTDRATIGFFTDKYRFSADWKEDVFQISRFIENDLEEDPEYYIKEEYFEGDQNIATVTDPEKNDALQFLNLPQHANLKQVERRVRELQKMYHPDKREGDEEMSKKINNMYDILKAYFHSMENEANYTNAYDES